jgi:membrane-bound lytic murein transglycosylase B
VSTRFRGRSAVVCVLVASSLATSSLVAAAPAGAASALATPAVRPVAQAPTPSGGPTPDAAGAQPGAPSAVPPPGVGLSPEVAAVPASSPELDAAARALEDLVEQRDRATEELADAESSLARDTAELAAVSSLRERRAAQSEKAAATAGRVQGAVAAITVERFVTGDQFLEGLDPALTAARREELTVRAMLTQVGTEQLLEEQGFTRARAARLRDELDELSNRETMLRERVANTDARRASLNATLADLGPRIVEAEARRDAARMTSSIDGTDMSAIVLDAYWRAAQLTAATDPTCRVGWSTLAGIGRTESQHGTYRGAAVAADGAVAPPIYGPSLDGSNPAFAVVGDSDGGVLDGTAATDRAVGPMQFLPGTWRVVGTDLTGDGTADPHNIYDAAASAATYLCRSGPDLVDPGRLRAAVLTYNRSQAYADIVLERADGYATTVPLG